MVCLIRFEQAINELYKSHGEENVSRDYFSLNKGPRSYKLKYAEDEVVPEKNRTSFISFHNFTTFTFHYSLYVTFVYRVIK
jgi:hypothetical protein